MSNDMKRLDKARKVQKIADAIRSGDPTPYIALSRTKLFGASAVLVLIGAMAGYLGSGLAPYYTSRDACVLDLMPSAATNRVANIIYRACDRYD